MKRLALIILLMMLPTGGAMGANAMDYDAYGGWTGITGKKTGFFHVERIDRRWWIISPDGAAFFSKGVCPIRAEGDMSPALGYAPYRRTVEAKYKSTQEWATATAARLTGWGMNTIGAWSGAEMSKTRLAYTPILNLAGVGGKNTWLKGEFPDVFDPAFAMAVDERAKKMCEPHKDDPYLLGYFLDNELHWSPDWRGSHSLLNLFLALPGGAAGKTRADAFMFTRGGAEPTAEDSAAFLQIVAGQYFKVTCDAIRKHDPNHMILGCRFAAGAPEAAIAALKDYVDIVSINDYEVHPPMKLIDKIADELDKPTMITEFAFKAMDSGLPNTKGAAVPVQTQRERTAQFDHYARILAKSPNCVGYHWFEYVDEPAEGRFDGENSNYGMVDINDQPYETLVATMKALNQVELRRAAER